ncbi:MAG: hypothetical protein HY670_10840 [Chloroflexi bacterium]|nr:hypothetical protein [Chloroflexota bacterium]
MLEETVAVRCYSGYTYAQRPVAFRWRDRDYDVQSITGEWREPGQRCFRVCTAKGKEFQLCYSEMEERWTVNELVK